MTQDEFLRKYHNYRVTSLKLATKEMEEINKIGIDNDAAVVRRFLGYYCLMLKSASDYLLEEIGI